MRKLSNYLSASFEELKKVVWPTRKQALWFTGAVVVVSLVVGLYLTGLDSVFRSILQKLILGS